MELTSEETQLPKAGNPSVSPAVSLTYNLLVSPPSNQTGRLHPSRWSEITRWSLLITLSYPVLSSFLFDKPANLHHAHPLRMTKSVHLNYISVCRKTIVHTCSQILLEFPKLMTGLVWNHWFKNMFAFLDTECMFSCELPPAAWEVSSKASEHRKIITVECCHVCRWNRALEKRAGKFKSRSGWVLIIAMSSHLQMSRKLHHRSLNGEGGNHAFISCQSGFIDLKWRPIIVML